MRKLRIIFFISIPVFGIMLILIGLTLNSNSLIQQLLLTIGAGLIGASVVLLFERLIVGDPLDNVYQKMALFTDANKSGLTRLILDRNAFFTSDEFLKIFENAKTIKIQGMVLGFLATNRTLLETLEKRAKSKANIEIVLSHPQSHCFVDRDNEEGWDGTLKDRLKDSLNSFLKIKSKHPDNVHIQLFKGEILNTIIATESCIVVNNYIFGKRGWTAPVFVFSRINESIISDYEGQFDEIKNFALKNPTAVVLVENTAQIQAL